MSRSGYSDDCESWGLIKWRGQVASAIRGKRGQKLLWELSAAMDAMSIKELFADELKTADGGFCALGVVGQYRGIDMTGIDPENEHQVARTFDIARQLAQEIVFINDENGDVFVPGDTPWNGKYRPETPAERWQRVRQWVAEQLIVWDTEANQEKGHVTE